jgi:AbrB family looped-hinge helix DNA binding protein
MSWNAQVDTNNRVTLPKAMREKLGICPGDEFDFHLVDQRVLVVRRSDQLTLELLVLTKEAA